MNTFIANVKFFANLPNLLICVFYCVFNFPFFVSGRNGGRTLETWSFAFYAIIDNHSRIDTYLGKLILIEYNAI